MKTVNELTETCPAIQTARSTARPEPKEEVNHDLLSPMRNTSSADIPHVNMMRTMVPMNSAKNSRFCIISFKEKMVNK